MEQKEFEKLISITSTETITDNSYIALGIDEVDNPFGMWGWSEKIENIRDHFLYVFILGNMVEYNVKKEINKVSNELIMAIYNDEMIDLNKLSKEEKKFIKQWDKLTKCNNIVQLQISSSKLCSYLTTLGYVMEYKLFKNPKETIKSGGVIGTYVPLEQDEFFNFLKNNIEND